MLVREWNKIENDGCMRSTHTEKEAIYKLRDLIRLGIVSDKVVRKGFYIVNFAFNRSGIVKISKPCLSCSRFIKTCGLTFHRIEWTTSDGDFDVGKQETIDSSATLSLGERNRLMCC